MNDVVAPTKVATKWKEADNMDSRGCVDSDAIDLETSSVVKKRKFSAVRTKWSSEEFRALRHHFMSFKKPPDEGSIRQWTETLA